MPLSPPQINVPLVQGNTMTLDTYQLLLAIYEKLVELEARIEALEP